MEKDDSGSIFDRASDWSKKKRPLKKQRREPVIPSSAQSANPPATTQSAGSESAAEMIKRMRNMQDELDGKMLDLYAKIGVSRSVADQFFADSRNVPPAVQASIQNQLTKLENQLSNILGSRVKKVTQEFKAAKEGDKRKKKMIGQRRKWLQM